MDRKGVIGIILCVVLLLLWHPIMVYLGVIDNSSRKDRSRQAQENAAPSREASSSQAEEPYREPGTSAETTSENGDSRTEEGRSQAPQLSGDRSGARTDGFPDLADSVAEETLTLSSPGYFRARLDKKRGGIMTTALEQYFELDGEEHVRLGTGRFPYCRVVSKDTSYQLRNGEAKKVRSGKAVTLTRQTPNDHVKVIEKWALKSEKPYRLSYTVTFRNEGDSAVNLDRYVVGAGDMRPVNTGGRSKMASVGLDDLAVHIAFADEDRPVSYDIGDVRDAKTEDRNELAQRDIRWVALHNKYFLYFLEREGDSIPGVRLGGREPEEEPKAMSAQIGLPQVALAPGGIKSYTFNAYAGPKKYTHLSELSDDVDTVMNLDLFLFFHPSWMAWITKAILRSLLALNDFFNHKWGYGFAIILITMVIKTIFWPLTHRSTVSMRKMQNIQPLIKEIRDKYKDQPQKMQQKTMELYREHKVNPLGGCLPIVFQIPVFFALFNTLRGAVELRQAEFLWVQDLSMPDTLPPPFQPFGFPIRPLAIFMAVSMFFQQRLMPSAADPQQKRMMSFMTIFFVFIFYNMPAGLTLYWSVNQVLTIFQNLVSHKVQKAREESS